jgi:hypothetical protein
MLLPLGMLFQQFGTARFGYIYILVGTMPATITAAYAFAQVKLFSKHYIALFGIVKILTLF